MLAMTRNIIFGSGLSINGNDSVVVVEGGGNNNGNQNDNNNEMKNE